MANLLQSFSVELAAKPSSEQTGAVKEAFNALPNEQKKVMVEALGLHPIPIGAVTGNKVWLIVIYAFVFSMTVAVLVLGVSVFIPVTNGVAKPDMMLTIFTATTAFIAGLFSPSPMVKKDGG